MKLTRNDLRKFFDMLRVKNRMYGNCAMRPPKWFSDGDSLPHLIDQKIGRLLSDQLDDPEDTLADLAGYLFFYMPTALKITFKDALLLESLIFATGTRKGAISGQYAEKRIPLEVWAVRGGTGAFAQYSAAICACLLEAKRSVRQMRKSPSVRSSEQKAVRGAVRCATSNTMRSGNRRKKNPALPTK